MGVISGDQVMPRTEQGFQAPKLPGTFDITAVQGGIGQVSKLLTSGNPLSAATISQVSQYLTDSANALLAEQQRLNPLPPNPIEDTPEQQDAIQKNPDIRSQMDSFREQIGMPGMLASRIDLTQKIQAITDTFQAAIDEVQNNPDLPKGLAARRITLLTEQGNKALKGFQNRHSL